MSVARTVYVLKRRSPTRSLAGPRGGLQPTGDARRHPSPPRYLRHWHAYIRVNPLSVRHARPPLASTTYYCGIQSESGRANSPLRVRVWGDTGYQVTTPAWPYSQNTQIACVRSFWMGASRRPPPLAISFSDLLPMGTGASKMTFGMRLPWCALSVPVRVHPRGGLGLA